MHRVTLLCGRCGARLVPAMSGPKCPRMNACGFGGMVEQLLFHPHRLHAGEGTDVHA